MPRLTSIAAVLLLWGVTLGHAQKDDAKAWMGQPVYVAPDVYAGAAAGPRDPAAAERRFAAATAAVEAGRLSEAIGAACRTLHADPDHAAARSVLGYRRIDGRWATPYEARQLERGLAWDARYGWVDPEDTQRYERGERRVGRRWIAADAAPPTRIEDGWQVRTDQFHVKTDVSLEAAARLAAELETFAQAWRQLFAGYWATPRALAECFAGERAAPRSRRAMRVYYHRSPDAYAEHLRRLREESAGTLGVYLPRRREAHFYCDPDADPETLRETLYHEAAHQLFAERGVAVKAGRDAGKDALFWLLEGVACYCELLAPVAGEARFTLGHPAQGRLPSAVLRGPQRSLAELSALGPAELARLPHPARVYAQATGVVALLRHGPSAESDRAALDRTLRSLYSGRTDATELSRELGRGYGELDAEYSRFLMNLSR
ncbi:MAG: hypothetical protein AAF805_01115 [Planctomycetota bacterium]